MFLLHPEKQDGIGLLLFTFDLNDFPPLFNKRMGRLFITIK
jgi:hypothetical protein